MFARTERLLLRPGWIEDAPTLAQAIGHDSIMTNLSWGRWPCGEDAVERWLRHARDSLLPSLMVLSRTEQAPELVGGAGLHRMADRSIEMDLWIRPQSRGFGIATEAGRALLGLAQALGLRHLTACVFSENGAAARVLGKLGFAASDTMMRRCATRNALVPATRFSRSLELGSRDPKALLAA